MIVRLKQRILELEREKQEISFRPQDMRIARGICDRNQNYRDVNMPEPYETTYVSNTSATYQPEPRQSIMNLRTPSKMQERSDHVVQSRTVSTVISEPYKSRLPFYNGKGDWRTFMIQLQIIAERNNWSPHQQAEEILLVLKDEALNFATELTPEIRSSFRLLNAEMERRFGNKNFPETYRWELLCAKKQYKENIHEYAARIENMVRKAYSGMDRQLFSNLSIEYMLAGLPDQSISYDVMTKRPTTMEETINLVTWHLTCKSGTRGRTRQSY